jgi:RimJ/RimL family protein N-acetyltransferase
MVFETARLLLREYTMADIDELFEILSDAETSSIILNLMTKR